MKFPPYVSARISSQITGFRRFLLENAEYRVMNERPNVCFSRVSLWEGEEGFDSLGGANCFPRSFREFLRTNLREYPLGRNLDVTESQTFVYICK